MTRRFQFSLRELLVAMLVVAAFFGGMAVQAQRDKPLSHRKITVTGDGGMIHSRSETMVLRDGTTWHRDFGATNVEANETNHVVREGRQLSRRPAQRPLFTRSTNKK